MSDNKCLILTGKGMPEYVWTCLCWISLEISGFVRAFMSGLYVIWFPKIFFLFSNVISCLFEQVFAFLLIVLQEWQHFTIYTTTLHCCAWQQGRWEFDPSKMPGHLLLRADYMRSRESHFPPCHFVIHFLLTSKAGYHPIKTHFMCYVCHVI